jgi:hypothetical protein
LCSLLVRIFWLSLLLQINCPKYRFDSFNSIQFNSIQYCYSCQYLADSLNLDLAKESVCICDDDNDIEMALACAHAYIPALTSESVVECIRDNPYKLTQTFQEGLVEETFATEAALQLINECL